MRVAYLDCIGGISGDMFVGALLSAGWSESALRASVAWLGEEIRELAVEKRQHMALTGMGIRVTSRHDAHPAPESVGAESVGAESVGAESAGAESGGAESGGADGHRHDAHSGQEAEGAGGHHHAHRRGFTEVMRRIEPAGLDPAVFARVRQVFWRLAEAEGHAHGVAPEKVHFHEVGAVDAMVDVVAACQGLHDLGIETLHVSTLPVGSGTIAAAHGPIPLPAPATAYLLQKARVRWAGPGERTTPTGAALVTTLGVQDPPPEMTIEAVGVGAGTRPLPDTPNLARLMIGRAGPATGPGAAGEDEDAGAGAGAFARSSWRQVVELATQIDDADPEELAVAADGLRAKGARDVFMTPIVMKRGRPGVLLTVIGLPEDESILMNWILDHTPSLGVRRNLQWRRELARKCAEVSTVYGLVPVKYAWKGAGWVGKPESQACARLALEAGVAYREVWRAAAEAAAAEAAAGAPAARPTPGCVGRGGPSSPRRLT